MEASAIRLNPFSLAAATISRILGWAVGSPPRRPSDSIPSLRAASSSILARRTGSHFRAALGAFPSRQKMQRLLHTLPRLSSRFLSFSMAFFPPGARMPYI